MGEAQGWGGQSAFNGRTNMGDLQGIEDLTTDSSFANDEWGGRQEVGSNIDSGGGGGGVARGLQSRLPAGSMTGGSGMGDGGGGSGEIEKVLACALGASPPVDVLLTPVSQCISTYFSCK